MLCDNCKQNEATGYIEEIINGVKRHTNLCAKCFVEKQKTILSFDMYSGIVGVGSKKYRCSVCGTDLNHITKTLFVGCPSCYSELKEYLLPVIKNIQSSATHVGASPNQSVSELDVLRAELKKAIAEERFEDAAAINKKIKLAEANQ